MKTLAIFFYQANWGDYPILVHKNKVDNLLNFYLWVGLNDKQRGTVLEIKLIQEYINDQPNEKNLQFWENFITKTTQLKGGDYFKACGQDMQEGYTITNVHGKKIKMIAEKRESDGAMQVVVIPENADVEYRYIDMIEANMGATWNYLRPLVKIRGDIIQKNGTVTNITNQVTSIFFKTVTEFSYNKEDGKIPLIFQKICEKQMHK